MAWYKRADCGLSRSWKHWETGCGPSQKSHLGRGRGADGGREAGPVLKEFGAEEGCAPEPRPVKAWPRPEVLLPPPRPEPRPGPRPAEEALEGTETAATKSSLTASETGALPLGERAVAGWLGTSVGLAEGGF